LYDMMISNTNISNINTITAIFNIFYYYPMAF